MDNKTYPGDISSGIPTENNFTSKYEEIQFMLSAWKITTVSICGIGTVLNSLVIIVILYGSLMRTSIFMVLLLVLAVFDNAYLLCVAVTHSAVSRCFAFTQLLMFPLG